MKFRWSIQPSQPLMAGTLAREAGMGPLFAQCLLNRGISLARQAADYLDPRLKNLADPFLLPDMDRAVERLYAARSAREPFVIFGDYDVDGVTSTALLLEFFSNLGWQAHSYLPHRLDEGYGLTMEAVDKCLAAYPVRLILAVDCGSSSSKVIRDLKMRGIEVIVLDHHQVADPAPEALALVNPHRIKVAGPCGARSSLPPYGELCSAGLAFKLAHALLKHGRANGLPEPASFDLRPLLDLVALGTVADIAPMIGENRILVAAGLQRLTTTSRPGLMALKNKAKCPSQIGTYEVGFQLAPRLNAAGRLESAADALQLLMASDRDEAEHLAEILDTRNRDRQNIEKTMAQEAIARVESRFRPEKDFVIVEGHDSWHIGVVGIVASRVLKQFYRPTIIVGGQGGEWRGSGRSIPGFDLAGALRDCTDLLVRHGGHAMAAGVAIDPQRLDTFREKLNQCAQRTLSSQVLSPALELDAEVGLEEISLKSLSDFQRLAPHGLHNASVKFCARRLRHARPLERVGAEKQHVKFWASDGVITHECVWWGAGNESLPVGEFDLAFEPQVNDFNGRRTVQLKVLDWQASNGLRV